MVDIGAHGGDTTIPLAVVAGGGKTIGFEMGPPYQLLSVNTRLNEKLDIDIYNKAVSDKTGNATYKTGQTLQINNKL